RKHAAVDPGTCTLRAQRRTLLAVRADADAARVVRYRRRGVRRAAPPVAEAGRGRFEGPGEGAGRGRHPADPRPPPRVEGEVTPPGEPGAGSRRGGRGKRLAVVDCCEGGFFLKREDGLLRITIRRERNTGGIANGVDCPNPVGPLVLRKETVNEMGLQHDGGAGRDTGGAQWEGRRRQDHPQGTTGEMETGRR